MIADLLKMLLIATRAESVEFTLLDPDGHPHPSNQVIGQPIGAALHESHNSLHVADVVETGPDCAEWIHSLLAVPISGPSAEHGWLVAAHQDPAWFDDSASESMAAAARLVEHNLDRAMEHDRIGELGTQIRDHQHELRRAHEQLELSNRELEQFAYIAAHELVAPLRAVAIYADVLESVAGPGDVSAAVSARECVSEIQTGIQRMTEQVHYLLSLSQTQVEDDSLELVSVGELVDAALDTLAVPLAEVDAQVSVGELPIVRARAIPLQSVFANLLTNAIRYRSVDRQLTVQITATMTNAGPRVHGDRQRPRHQRRRPASCLRTLRAGINIRRRQRYWTCGQSAHHRRLRRRVRRERRPRCWFHVLDSVSASASQGRRRLDRYKL